MNDRASVYTGQTETDFSILESLTERRLLKAGEKLFSAGEEASEMFVVYRGRLGVTYKGEDLDTVGPRGMVGEMALTDLAVRSADVAAMEDTEVIVISQRTFLFLVHETPYFALDVMRSMAARIRQMNERAKA